MRMYLSRPTVLGPGFADWASFVALADDASRAPALDEPATLPKIQLLSPTERRRLSRTSKLALHLAEQTLSADMAARTPVVFTSLAGDSHVCDNLCRALATPDRAVSPTQFHNSVHNAPAGYWAIAHHSQAQNISIAAGFGSFAAGLLEAATLAAADRAPVALVAYDVEPPPPLDAAARIHADVGFACLLHPERSDAPEWSLQLDLVDAATTQIDQPGRWQGMVDNNPIAWALPLADSLARGQGKVILPFVPQQHLQVGVKPA